MKLKQFNQSNLQMLPRATEATVRISASAGLISFSIRAIAEMKLSSEDKLNFIQDEESPTDWYVEKTKDRNGIPVRTRDNRVEFNNSRLAILILASVKSKMPFGKEVKSAGFRIKTKPVEVEGRELYLILTSNPIIKENKNN
jgi:hypothetical protein